MTNAIIFYTALAAIAIALVIISGVIIVGAALGSLNWVKTVLKPNAESRRGYEKLKDLIEKWENISRRKFFDAEDEDDEMGKKLIEHGAMCYFNCANDLKEALACSLPHSLATLSKDQT